MSFTPSKATTGLGAIISIGAVTGSTGTETFVPVGEITDIKSTGYKRNTTSFAELGNNSQMNKLGTTIDSGTITVTCAYVPNDPGQLAVLAACQDGEAYDFKVQSAVNKKIGQTTVGDLRALSAIVTEAGGLDMSAGKEQTFTFTLDIDGPVTFTAGS